MLWTILALVAIVAGYGLARWKKRAEPIRSLIVLYREPTLIMPERLKGYAEQAGMTLEVGEEPLDFKLDGYALRVLMAPVPYGTGFWTVDQLVKDVAESRLREAIREHKAFASYWYRDSRLDEWPQAIEKVGRLIAESADEQALVLWRADTNQAIRLTEESRERLRNGETLEALGELSGDEVMEIEGDDPRLEEAVTEARRRWPEFVEAVRRIDNPEVTIVKARFHDEENEEHMWVNVHHADEAVARGILGSKPFRLRSVKEGQEVEVQASEISDWAYIEGGDMVGAFTEKVVRRIEE